MRDRKRTIVWFLVTMMIVFGQYKTVAQEQITDLQFQSENLGSSMSDFVRYGDLVFFGASTFTEGREMWVSDGTSEGTKPLGDFNPGTRNGIWDFAFSNRCIVFDDLVYFSATVKDSYQLWVSDGSASGTKLLFDFGNHYVYRLIELKGDLIISTEADNISTLWKLEKGSTNLQMITTIEGDRPNHHTVIDDILYFHSKKENTNYRWHRSDGTPEGTYQILGDIGANELHYYVDNQFNPFQKIASYNNEIFFISRETTTGSSRVSLFKSDGITENKVPLKVLISSGQFPYSSSMIVYQGKLYISYMHEAAFGNRLVFEIFQSDGTPEGTFRIHRGGGGLDFYPSNLVANDGKLYFTDVSYFGKTILNELDISTQTETQVAEIEVNFPPDLHYRNSCWIDKVKDNTYFITVPENQGLETKAYLADFSEGKVQLLDSMYWPNRTLEIHNDWIPMSGNSKDFGTELFRTDLNLESPQLIKDINSYKGGANIGQMTIVDNGLVFTADDGTNGNELWRFQNNELSLIDVNLGKESASPSFFHLSSPYLYFSAYSEEFGREPYRLNLNTNQTELLGDIVEGNESSNPHVFWDFQESTYFITEENEAGNLYYEYLQRVKGDSITTRFISPTTFPGTTREVLSTDNYFYFDRQNHFLSGNETKLSSIISGKSYNGMVSTDSLVYVFGSSMWKTDGTSEGTTELLTFTGWGNAGNVIKLDSLFLFTTASLSDVALRVSDGTRAGTHFLFDSVDTAGPKVDFLLPDVWRGNAVFTVETVEQSVELWISDGTKEGTKMVLDFEDLGNCSNPRNFRAFESGIYFEAFSPDFGTELWRLEAPDSVPKMMFDLNPGLASSLPGQIVEKNDQLFFTAIGGSSGRQLWKHLLVIDRDNDGFTSNEDCDDENTAVNPAAGEIPYDGIDNDCDSTTPDDDLDGDGFLLVDDCDDNNAEVNSDAVEVPYDGIDNDCDPATPDDDLDGDGFVLADDCDDNDATINPAAEEISDNDIDENCDGNILVTDVVTNKDWKIRLVPNPSNGKAYIYSTCNQCISQITIFDSAGRLMKSQQSLEVDMGAHGSGLYFISIEGRNGVVHLRMIVE